MIARLLVASLVCAFFVGSIAPADAGTLRTLHVRANGNQNIRVIVTNLGAKPIEDLVVTLTSPSGTVVTPSADLCAEGGPLPPRNTCQVSYGSDQSGFATVTAKGKFSASIQLLDGATSQTIAVIPAAK
jgi:hypothetical protein